MLVLSSHLSSSQHHAAINTQLVKSYDATLLHQCRQLVLSGAPYVTRTTVCPLALQCYTVIHSKYIATYQVSLHLHLQIYIARRCALLMHLDLTVTEFFAMATWLAKLLIDSYWCCKCQAVISWIPYITAPSYSYLAKQKFSPNPNLFARY